MLRDMMMVRVFDDRMYRAQRQGKTSFYMNAPARRRGGRRRPCARPGRHVFPTYRQQGLLIARGYPLVEMINQIYSNRGDKLKGRQLPIMYSAGSQGFFTISGNLGTQLSAGDRLGDGQRRSRATAGSPRLDRRGRDRRGRLPQRADLRRRLQRADGPQRRQQPVGDLELLRHSPGERLTTFAARAIGYGIAGLASTATTAGGLCRRALGGGPGALEPRADADRALHLPRRGPFHLRRSDRLPPQGAGRKWPLGDPIARLKAI
jgi:2-oxoisovalerate dehydrogenase E1 component alpha subunit